DLALCADRLQRKSVAGTAEQRVGADADADRGVALDAAVVAGEVAGMDRAGRREHDPAQRHVLGHAEINSEAMDDAHVGVRRTDGVNTHSMLSTEPTTNPTPPGLWQVRPPASMFARAPVGVAEIKRAVAIAERQVVPRVMIISPMVG